MSRPLIITPEAEKDLALAKSWYDDKRAGLGDRFVLCVEAALAEIMRAPEGSREVHPGVRRIVVRKFPYGIFYRVDPDQIVIIAVYHSKRDPRGWQSRVND
jgi:plasmid stabilization system protein ParE